jgi:hypothetical protein
MLLSYFDHLPTFISRGKYNDKDHRNNVIWIRGFQEGSYWIKDWSFSHNIITNHGRAYYALRGVIGTPASNEGSTRFQLANPATQNGVAITDTWNQFDTPNGAAIAGSNQPFTGGYPRVSDPDSDNTGAGVNVMSHQTFYNQASFTADPVFVKNGCIHDNPSPVDATKLICHFPTPTGTGVQKQSTDTLKTILNHPVSSS